MDALGLPIGSRDWFAAWWREETDRMTAERPTPAEIDQVRRQRDSHRELLNSALALETGPLEYKPCDEEKAISGRDAAAGARQHQAMRIRLRYARAHRESYWDVRPVATGRWMTRVYGGPPWSTVRSRAHAALCWAGVLASGVVIGVLGGPGAGVLAGGIAAWLIGLVLLKDNLSFAGFLVVLAALGFQYGPTGFHYLFGGFRSHWFGAVVFMLIPLYINSATVRADLLDKTRRRILPAWHRWCLLLSFLPALAITIWVLRETIMAPIAPGTPTTKVTGGGAVLGILLIIGVVLLVTTMTWPPCAGAVRAVLRIVAGLDESVRAVPPIPVRGRRERVFYQHLDAARIRNYAVVDTAG